MYLEERLQEVERQLKSMNHNGGRLMERVAILERTVYNCTDDALKEPITAKDVDRWRAIEKAAKALVSCLASDRASPVSVLALLRDDLKAALVGLRS